MKVSTLLAAIGIFGVAAFCFGAGGAFEQHLLKHRPVATVLTFQCNKVTGGVVVFGNGAMAQVPPLTLDEAQVLANKIPSGMAIELPCDQGT